MSESYSTAALHSYTYKKLQISVHSKRNESLLLHLSGTMSTLGETGADLQHPVGSHTYTKHCF